MRQKEKGNRIFHIKGGCHIKRQESSFLKRGGFFFRDPHGEILFFWSKGGISGFLEGERGRDFFFRGEQRDPHREGSHLNASKADFFL